MPYCKSLLFVLCSALVISCTSTTDTSPDASGSTPNISLADSGETHLLRDDMQPLTGAPIAMVAREDTLFVADSDPFVALFVNHEMTRTFGRSGKGPCEYVEVDALTSNGDSLFVLSASQGKIITYHVSTGECLGEIQHQSLQRSSYLERAGGTFLTGRPGSPVGSSDSTRLLHRLNGDGTMEAMPLDKGTFDPVPIRAPFSPPGINFARSGNLLYYPYTLSQVLGVADLATGEIDSFALHHEIDREAFAERSGEPGGTISVLNEGLAELVWRVHATQRWVAVYTLRIFGEKENQGKIYFYTPGGKLIHERTLDSPPRAVLGNRMLYVEPTDDGESGYAYQVEYREVTME